MKTLRAEFHIHTILSPCASMEMVPPRIIASALKKGINIIAISDHNATGNIAAVQAAADGSGVTVLPAMELSTREEVHVLCLFDTLDQALEFQTTVDTNLPDLSNDVDQFGEQFLVDQNGAIIRSEIRKLATTTSLSLEQAFEKVSVFGGLFIPSHVDRVLYGLLPTLGKIPESIPFEALEISRMITPQEAYRKFPDLMNYPIIQSGDVHHPDEFLGVNELTLEAISIEEIRLALQSKEGRTLKLLPITT